MRDADLKVGFSKSWLNWLQAIDAMAAYLMNID